MEIRQIDNNSNSTHIITKAKLCYTLQKLNMVNIKTLSWVKQDIDEWQKKQNIKEIDKLIHIR